MGKFIAGIPPNVLTEKSKSGVIRLIHSGSKVKGNEMPAFKKMPHKESKLIVNHLFKLRKQFLEK